MLAKLSMTAPEITTIIVNYNAGDRLRMCLEHLEAQTFQNFETIIVDNASTDQSMASAVSDSLSLQKIEPGSNIGFAAANNLAAARARGIWLAFLNPDAYPEKDWLARLLDAAKRFPFADAFGSTQLDAKNPAIIDGAGDVYHAFGIPYRGHFGWPVERLPPEGACFAPCAAAAMYRRATFDWLGGFDESFFCYGEDVDLGFRLRLSGGTCIQVREAKVRHEGSGITGRQSDFTIYHGHRNRIWTFYKNMPAPLLLLLTPFNILTNLYLLARALPAGFARAYFRAFRDGYLGLGTVMKKRRAVQRARNASWLRIAKSLTWSTVKVSKREADVRPLP